MKTRLALIPLFLCVCLMTGGCLGRVVGEGAGRILGPKGKVNVLSPISADPTAKPLAAYQHFVIENFTSDIPTPQAQQAITLLPDLFAHMLAERRVPDLGSGKTLLIRGKIVHYETATTADQAFGPLEEVIARVELVDRDSRHVIGVANCVGRTRESNMMGVKSKAEGLAKAIAEWIEANYPEDQKTPKKKLLGGSE